MAALIAGYLLSSTCGTLVQGPRSSLLSRSAAVPETRNPNGSPLCPLPSPPPVRPTVVFADAEEVGRALDDARPLSCGAAPSSSPLLASCFTPSVGREGTRLTRGEERDEKRGGGGERERKKGEKNWWKFRGEGKEAEEKRGGRRCRGLILRPPIGSLATGSPTFAANRLSPRWLTSIVLERV